MPSSKWNRYAPLSLIRSAQKDITKLVGTSWSDPVRFLQVIKVSEDRLVVIDHTLRVFQLFPGEILGPMSRWSYEGRDISWAAPRRIVVRIETREICEVLAWGSYRSVMDANRNPVFEDAYGYTPFGRSRGRIRGVVRSFHVSPADQQAIEAVLMSYRAVRGNLVPRLTAALHRVDRRNLATRESAVRAFEEVFHRADPQINTAPSLDLADKPSPPTQKDTPKSAAERLLERDLLDDSNSPQASAKS